MVVVCSEQFRQLAMAIIRSQGVPQEIAIVIERNPEMMGDDELVELRARLLDEAMRRLMR